jgi:type I restriction enzyme S subunit
MSQASQVRTYDPSASVVFLKTNERFGGLSNMAPGFPLRVNGVRIRTSEALYQACRFPHLPDVQRKIIDEHSPMTAKMRSKPFRKDSRSDWDAVRVKIMRWCLRVKLAQNWREFGRLLLATGDRPIVEQSRKDDFWGAKVAADGSLVGMNVLGRLLMELREQLKGDEVGLYSVEPLAITEFLLFQQPIEMICAERSPSRPAEMEPGQLRPVAPPPPRDLPQPSLFDQPMIAKGQMDIQTNPAVVANSNKDLKPYSGYRDSGLPWLGRIPEHWDVRRNGRLFAERNQTGFEDLPILEVSLRTGVRVRDMENGARKQQMTDRSKYKRAAKGDVAYNMMRMWQGAVGVAPVDGLISPAYVVARPFAEVEPPYYAYLFRTDAYMREVNKFSRGIVSDRNRLYWDEFKQMPSVFPPTDEQARISKFLDAHGRLTARLIRNKRRLIGLLNEQKQAIINRAVTRGLNPDAPMKPTGIDWMPEVPAHWGVKPLKWLLKSIFGGSTPPSAQADCWDGNIVWVTPEDISRNDRLSGSQRTITEVGLKACSTALVPPGSVIITSRAPVGNVAIADVELATNQGCKALVPDTSAVDSEFLFELMRILKPELNSLSTGTTFAEISTGRLARVKIAIPAPNEQRAILSAVQGEIAPLKRAIEQAEKELILIREYRDRLIADVVTGKLDVRHVEIAAPADEPIADEDDALEEELEGDDAEVTEGADADD